MTQKLPKCSSWTFGAGDSVNFIRDPIAFIGTQRAATGDTPFVASLMGHRCVVFHTPGGLIEVGAAEGTFRSVYATAGCSGRTVLTMDGEDATYWWQVITSAMHTAEEGYCTSEKYKIQGGGE